MFLICKHTEKREKFLIKREFSDFGKELFSIISQVKLWENADLLLCAEKISRHIIGDNVPARKVPFALKNISYAKVIAFQECHYRA